MEIGGYARQYLGKLKLCIDKLSLKDIETISNILKNAYKDDRQVFIMGNGGSAATASHWVCDLAKGTVISRKKRFKAIALTDNIPLMTAWSNDSSYEDLFKEQLVNLLQEGDVVIGISGSGNSANVLRAIQYANSHGARTVGLTGFTGGKLKDFAQVCLIVPSDNMERIEDLHLVLAHLIKLYLWEEIAKNY